MYLIAYPSFIEAGNGGKFSEELTGEYKT